MKCLNAGNACSIYVTADERYFALLESKEGSHCDMD